MGWPNLWWSVVLISALLVGLGVLVLSLDVRKSRAAKTARAKSSGATAGAAAAPLPHWPSLAPRTARTGRGTSAYDAPPDDDGPMTGPILQRVPAVEAHWLNLKREIDAAVASINQQIARLGLVIATPGAPSWSLQNYGFGDYRRVLLDSNSIAWLRIELGSDGTVATRLTAHDPEISMINGASTAPAQRGEGQLARTLLESLSTTTQYANWRLTNVPRTVSQRPRTVGVAQPLPATVVPSSAAALADEAIALVNSAFKETGARLMPLRTNQWPGSAGRDARVLAIDANGALAGTMLVDPQPDRIEIAITSGRSATANAAQRQSLPIAGLSVHSLAETVATSAWPAIAAALPAQA